MIPLIDLQITIKMPDIPVQSQFEKWITAVLDKEHQLINRLYNDKTVDLIELTIRIVNEAESAYLNETYRKRKGATNILSFPFLNEGELAVPLLGDLVLCGPLIINEAVMQNKAIAFHWAHLIIHGALHLLGYDHLEEEEAIQMEKREIDILQKLGYSNPYEDRDSYEC